MRKKVFAWSDRSVAGALIIFVVVVAVAWMFTYTYNSPLVENEFSFPNIKKVLETTQNIEVPEQPGLPDEVIDTCSPLVMGIETNAAKVCYEEKEEFEMCTKQFLKQARTQELLSTSFAQAYYNAAMWCAGKYDSSVLSTIDTYYDNWDVCGKVDACWDRLKVSGREKFVGPEHIDELIK